VRRHHGAAAYATRVRASAARRFWDSRAEEDAFFFVDDRLEYGSPDLERFWAEGEKDLETLLESVGAQLAPSDDAVDIGCGVGRLSRAMAERVRSVRAIDVSPRMLERARKHNADLDNVTWLLGDGTSLAGIESRSADAVVSHVVFQHIPDPEVTLGYVREIGRVLRPGGWGAFQISNDLGRHGPVGLVEKLRTRARELARRGPRGMASPYWRGSGVELGALRDAAGVASMDVERVVGEGTKWCIVRVRRRP
jgi:SAM-dependent methyltransferase